MSQIAYSGQPFRLVLPAVVFVTSIFFCNFLSRVVLAPLMPVVQADLGFTHAGAGHLFLALAVGNGIGLLFNGFVARALDHRRTVGVSAIMVGVLALLAPLARDYGMLMGALFGLGLSVGLYLPSGIAAVTSLVQPKDWGKSLAVHELAPNLSYVVAPILAEAVLHFFNWRAALGFLGGLQVCLGIWFLYSGKGGEFPGVVPNPDKFKKIIAHPYYWLLVLYFCMAVGASVGPYTMIPLYLTDAHGYTREQANHLLAVSRIAACFFPIIVGWMTDKWGAKPVIRLYLIANGFALVMLGLTSGSLLVASVLLQPVLSVIIFAPGFTMLSNAFGPNKRPIAIALMGPVNAIVGVGLVPTFLGHMGDAGMFDYGFLIQGCLLLASIVFLPLLPSGKLGD